MPEGCDTFVVRPEGTKEGWTIFGKNSDRPLGEVQEVVYEPPREGQPGRPLQCTYISIPDVGKTEAVVLSKPDWMWGAEMGANAAGVVIGNEAVWTKLQGPGDKEKRLLGMDLLRLGLERGATAAGALEAITGLLEAHGQGGPCAEDDPELLYHNSFLIADADEAWILETADRHWAAVKVTGAHGNISNNLTITVGAARESAGAAAAAKAAGFWDGEGAFAFGTAFAEGRPCSTARQTNGTQLLADFSKDGKFTVGNMLEVLRDSESGICMGQRTTGSMVSILPPRGSGLPVVHFLTGTPDPGFSVFKPFLFQGGATRASPLTAAPKPIVKGNRGHELWKANQAALTAPNQAIVAKELRAMEGSGVVELEAALGAKTPIPDPATLFHECADAELKILSAHIH